MERFNRIARAIAFALAVSVVWLLIMLFGIFISDISSGADFFKSNHIINIVKIGTIIIFIICFGLAMFITKETDD